GLEEHVAAQLAVTGAVDAWRRAGRVCSGVAFAGAEVGVEVAAGDLQAVLDAEDVGAGGVAIVGDVEIGAGGALWGGGDQREDEHDRGGTEEVCAGGEEGGEEATGAPGGGDEGGEQDGGEDDGVGAPALAGVGDRAEGEGGEAVGPTGGETFDEEDEYGEGE